MYYYIYDNYLAEKKYHSVVSKIESTLTDLGINGKIARLSVFKNIGNQLIDELRTGIKTIVIVGNNKTLNQSINLIQNLNIPIGFIPVGPDNDIANLLGIPEGEVACKTLSHRNIQQLRLASINDKYYFLGYLELPGSNLYINCDDNYHINIDGKKDVVIISNNYYGEYSEIVKNNQNNILNLTIKTNAGFFSGKKSSFSQFKAKKISINSDKSIPILLMDEKRIIKTPITTNISKLELNIIVGKNRVI